MCKLSTSCHHVLTSFHSYSSTPQRAPVHVDMCSAWKRRGWGWNPLLIAGSQHFAQWPGNHPQSGFTVTSSHWALTCLTLSPSELSASMAAKNGEHMVSSPSVALARWIGSRLSRLRSNVSWVFVFVRLFIDLRMLRAPRSPIFWVLPHAKPRQRLPCSKCHNPRNTNSQECQTPHPPSYKQCASCSWGAPETIGLSTDSMQIIIWDLFASNSTCN